MDALTPNRAITIGDKQFTLDGSFATLRAIQETLKRDVVRLLMDVTDMRTDELATMIAIASHGDPNEIGQHILDEIGVISPAFAALKTQVFAWLNIALCPKSDRQKKTEEMEALIASLSVSLGQNTSASA